MKWLGRLSALFIGLNAISMLKEIIKDNKILIIKDEDVDFSEDGKIADITELKPDSYDYAMDLRGTPTHECVCGCNIFHLKVMFEQGQISQYFLDMECASCGSLATAPTPVDDRNELD